MKFYRYAVRIDSTDPMYGNTRLVKDCGASKANAIKFVKDHGKSLHANGLLYIEEREFTSLENLQKNMPLYTRHIWSEAFHGYENLERI